MQFDDFGGFEVRCGHLGEVVGQHCGNGEIRCDEHTLVVAWRLGKRGAHLIKFLVGPAGGADHHIDALPDKCEHVVQGYARYGEFNHHIGVLRSDSAQIVAGIEREGELGVSCAVHGIDHVRAHAALGPDYGNLDHVCSLLLQSCCGFQIIPSMDSTYESKETLRPEPRYPVRTGARTSHFGADMERERAETGPFPRDNPPVKEPTITHVCGR